MIKINNLYKTFGDKPVLRGISLSIPEGKTYCIIGKSGCGKSVLIKHIVGLLEPDSGNVEVEGRVISKLNKDELFELRLIMGFVFQGAALFDSLSVYENVVIGLYEHGFRNEKMLLEEAKRVLSAVGLLPDFSENETENYETKWQQLKDKRTSDLSGGMKKRVGVARALVGKPKYIFYDEPTTGLDPVTSEQIDDLILRLANELNVTSVVITHDMFSVFRIADKVAMLNDGELRFEGLPEELNVSTDPIVMEFLDRYKK